MLDAIGHGFVERAITVRTDDGGAMTQPLHYLTIEAASALLRSGDLSPVELVDAHLRRIAALNETLHAFITVTGDTARAEATQAEREIRAGKYCGPLHGIPIAHKDLVCTKGVLTTAHSNLLKEWVPSENATVFDRLRGAGAISVGKTSLHEFGIGSPGADEAFPAARNPWNVAHMPGSSSSGSGAAVAAGLCMGATGSDTGGSVRHPAAVCALVGMKPTYGRVSARGVLPLATSMDHVGHMTRTVIDNAIMLQAMAGYDPKDPCSAHRKVPDFRRLIGKSMRGVRIGVPRRFIESLEQAPEVVAGFACAEQVFRDLGARIEDVDPAGLDESHEAGTQIITYEGFQYHREHLAADPDKYSVNFRGRFSKAAQITGDEYEGALRKAERLRASVAAIFGSGVDILISTGRERPAQTMAELVADPFGKRSVALRMYSVTGNPALVLPMGFSDAGLPLGLQVAAAHFREDRVYQAAHAYEQETQWCERHPAV